MLLLLKTYYSTHGQGELMNKSAGLHNSKQRMQWVKKKVPISYNDYKTILSSVY